MPTYGYSGALEQSSSVYPNGTGETNGTFKITVANIETANSIVGLTIYVCEARRPECIPTPPETVSSRGGLFPIMI